MKPPRTKPDLDALERRHSMPGHEWPTANQTILTLIAYARQLEEKLTKTDGRRRSVQNQRNAHRHDLAYLTADRDRLRALGDVIVRYEQAGIDTEGVYVPLSVREAVRAWKLSDEPKP